MNRAPFVRFGSWLFVLLFLLAPAIAGAQTATGLRALLDRELYFGNPEIASAQLSPDGKYIAFLKPWNETRNIWLKKTGESFSAARRLTAETKRPIPFFSFSKDSKYILFVKDKEGDENFNVYAVEPGAAPPAGQDVPGRAEPDRRQGRARVHLLGAQDGPRRALRRAQRPRRRLARRVQGQDLERRAHARAEEHGEDRGLDVRPRGPAAPGRAGGGQRRHRGPARGRGRLHAPLLLQRLRVVRRPALPQGRQAGLPADEQGRAGPGASRPVRSRDRQGRAGRGRSGEPRGFRGGDLLGGHGRARRHDLRGRAGPDVLPRQGTRRRLRAASAEAPEPRHRPRQLHRGRPEVAGHGPERRRPRRALPLRPEDGQPDPGIQGPRADPSRAHGDRAGPPLSLLGRPRDTRPSSPCPRASPRRTSR